MNIFDTRSFYYYDVKKISNFFNLSLLFIIAASFGVVLDAERTKQKNESAPTSGPVPDKKAR